MNVKMCMAVTAINKMPSLLGILPHLPELRNAAF